MKQSAPDLRKKKFLFRFVISYYVVLIIPFLLVIFTFRTAANVIMKQSGDEVQNALVQARNVTDANLKAMPSIAMTLRNDENVISFYETWERGEKHIFPAYKVNHHIPQFNATNSLISKVFLYFGKKTKIPYCFVIENGAAMEYIDALTAVKFDTTDLTYAELHEYITNRAFSEEYVSFPSNNNDKLSIYYMADLISYPSQYNSAVVMIRLDDGFLNDLLQNATFNDQGAAFILDEAYEMLVCRNESDLEEALLDELITQLPEQQKTQFEFQGQQINLVRSEKNGWIYGSVVPVSTMLAKLHQVRRVVLEAFILFLLLSLILLGILTRRNSRPLGRIFNELATIYSEPGKFDSSDDFRFIESAISDLINRSQEQTNMDDTKQRLLDLEVLGRLLLNGGTDSPFFQENLALSSLELEDRQLLVGYVHVHQLGHTVSLPREQRSTGYPQRLEEELGVKLYFYTIDDRNHVVLISCPSASNKTELIPSIKDLVNLLGEEYEQKTGYHIDFFLSDPTEDYHEINQCYSQCKDLAMHVIKDKSVYAYSAEDLPSNPQVFHFSLNQEIRLSQLIRYGSEAKLKELLDEIHYQNYELTSLNDAMQESLFHGIQSSLQRSLASYYHEEEIHTLLRELRNVETFERLSQTLFALQAAMQEHLRQSSARSNLDEIHQRILDYISQHYSNADLNQSLLCEDLGIAESILNHMFQEMGTSFHVYLENVRIDAACTLLQNQDLTIKRVAEHVGYTSDVSFRRAFKRVLGISPTAFKGREE